MSFCKYNDYKKTNFEWIEEVPSHWKLKKLKYCFIERREKVSDKTFKPLSVTKSGVVPQLEIAAKTDDGDNRKRVSIGDFVINSRSDRKGSSGLSKLEGSVSLINTVLKPNKDVYGSFIHYLFKSIPFQEEFYKFGKGIVADLWSTNFKSMSSITLALPPINEQKAIADFLDQEVSNIQNKIKEQELLINLLKEKNQAIILKAVTKGLNPKHIFKDTGMILLKKIPSHWQIKKLKYLIISLEQGWSPQCEREPSKGESPGVLKVGCVNGGVFNQKENKKLPPELSPVEKYQIKKDDLLISRANTRELVGSAAVAKSNFEWLYLCDKLYRIKIDKDQCIPDYVSFCLNSHKIRQEIEMGATGASQSMQNISQSIIKELTIPIPPLNEQKEIIDYLTLESKKIVSLINQIKKSIQLNTEKKDSVISSAVTGQINLTSINTRVVAE